MRRLAAVALGSMLIFSPVAKACKKKSPEKNPVHLFSKWVTGSCELIGKKLKIKQDFKNDMTVELSKEKEPVGIFCSSKQVAVLYPNKIELRGSPKDIEELKEMDINLDSELPVQFGIQAVITEISLEKKAIGGVFYNNGKEAVIAFETGQLGYYHFTDDGKYDEWISADPKLDKKLKKANAGEAGRIVYVEFPETGVYTAIFRDCDGDIRMAEGKIPEDSSLECKDDSCAVKDEKGKTTDEVSAPSCSKKDKK